MKGREGARAKKQRLELKQRGELRQREELTFGCCTFLEIMRRAICLGSSRRAKLRAT
jgi:hypothetical protein